MKRWIPILLAALLPLGAQAALPSKPALRKKIDGYVLEARNSKSTRDWLTHTRLISSMDREALLGLPDLPEQMPEIKRRFNDSELRITVDGITADFQNAAHGEVTINGEKLVVTERLSLPETLKRIDQLLAKKRFTLNLLPRWISPPRAEAEAIHRTCLRSVYELSYRSPTALMESNFGFVGRIFVASLVVSAVDVVGNVFANCKAQVKDMQKILRENNIGIKEIDCGSDKTGVDRGLEFWIPERDRKNAFKTRKFNLDYSISVAQEAFEKDEEKPEHKAQPLYVFGSSELEEVRIDQENKAENAYYCENVRPGRPKFEEMKKDIEPFRKIFEYIGNHNSCGSCASEMLRGLRTPKAPTYFPPELIGPPAPGTILISDEDDEEEEDVKPKKTTKKAAAAPKKAAPAPAPKKAAPRTRHQESAPAERHHRSAQ